MPEPAPLTLAAIKARDAHDYPDFDAIAKWLVSASALTDEERRDYVLAVVDRRYLLELVEGLAKAIAAHSCGIRQTWCAKHAQYHGDMLCAVLAAGQEEGTC